MTYEADAGTVRTYILISIVATFLSIPVWIVIGFVWLVPWWILSYPYVGPPIWLALVPSVIAFFVAVMIYLTTYDRVGIGDYLGARGPCLVWGILDLFSGLLVGGVFLLLAHSKLSDMTRGMSYHGSGQPQYSPPGYVSSPGRGSGAGAGSVCFGCGTTIPAASTACPRCGKRK